MATENTYDFDIRYASGDVIDRTAAFRYGDAQYEITFPRTCAWTQWSTVSETLELQSCAVNHDVGR